MTTLKCADLGMTCEFVATADTKEETKAAMQAHLAEAHADMTEEQKTAANAKMDELLNAEEAPAQTEQAEEQPEESPKEEATEEPAPAQETSTTETA